MTQASNQSDSVPVLRPSCTDEEIEAVADVLRSGWWGEGPKCAEVEKTLASMHGTTFCAVVNSCTAALHLALLSHDIGPGDEVIVPALTFASSALAVVYCGAKPVFADVHPDTLCLDPHSVADKMTRNTRAVMPVDFAGFPANWGGLPYGRSIIVQDAAHFCGGTAYGDSTCLSFHPVKNVATGDGGAILLNDVSRWERIQALRWCGIDRSTWRRSGARYAWDYQIAEVGYKSHWNDIQAAIALVQLRRYQSMQEHRRVLAARYLAGLGRLSDLITLPRPHAYHTWHLFTIRVDAKDRDALLDHLAARDISAGVHYKPLTYYPMFANQETPEVTDREWRRLISLPIFADMSIKQQDRVLGAIYDFYT